ncbi:MAG: site-specific integrase [Bacteroidales bacterium]|nr:site-specific integrase [Bacteroidales bacterium]
MARKKNSDIVKLREKKMANGNTTLFLDWYDNGVRNKEYLRLHINKKARTPLEKENNKRTLELAKKIRLERETQITHSNFGQIIPVKKKVAFFAFAENYKNNYTKKDIRMIVGAIQRFKDFLTEQRPFLNQKSLKIAQIDKVMMTDFVSYLESRSIGEGAHGYFQRFKKILKRAVDEEIIYKSPTDGIICKRVEGLRKDILTNDEIILLAKTPCQNSELKRAFLFCCSTGLRFVDVKALQYKNIDFANKKMTIDQIKTGKIAIIDLNTTALKMIGEQQHPDNYVFDLPSGNGSNKTLKAWVKRAGIDKHITWHCARHSFAVNLLTSEAKPDIKTVSSTLGHSSLKHTEKYTRVVDELKKKAVNALPDYKL